jgi:microsomal dipeptidase-like Zn-dependent dipeptidase
MSMPTSPARLSLLALLVSCGGEAPSPGPSTAVDFESQANGCFLVRSGDLWLTAGGTGDRYAFGGTEVGAARFTLRASDLGTYLLYDENAGYLVSDDGPLLRQTSLVSDATLMDDTYISGAEWVLETSEVDGSRYQLRNRRNETLLGPMGLTDATNALPISLEPAEGCVAPPELSLDATGTITKTTFDDGDLYGIVDTHSHVLSNWGFGGGGVYHGAPFHRLGVEHALLDCAVSHGEMGRQDFFGYVYDTAGNSAVDLFGLVSNLAAGELSVDNHNTAGYPDFTDWPDAINRSTHQVQYYRWLERAWMAGLRLEILHATTNSLICNLSVGEGVAPSRYDCEDMSAVDRILDEALLMERYIDAQSGGQGKGWFRIVRSPAEAREVITEGKLAVVLGIETSDLFRCNLTPRPDGPVCDEAYVLDQLDEYHERGVRAIFPVHKYDNAFTPGDGSGDFIELGNFFNSGHWTNMTEDCPGGGLPSGFDGGNISFGGLQQPRDEYASAAPNDFSAFPDAPLDTILPFVGEILEPSIEGHWCQNGTFTGLGETLMQGMMERGMIIEVDHLPEWSYQRAFELLEEYDYPAVGTHGRNWDGRIYALGGVSKMDLGRCQDPDNPGSTLSDLLARVDLKAANGGYPAEGFGLDLNGFAGAPGPRFGDNGCSAKQADPMTYPFLSYAGDVEFTEPWLGNRQVDFDTEGLVHIGLLPELLQDARADALSDADLEPLFRSAEGYVRMWEKAEERGAALGGSSRGDL